MRRRAPTERVVAVLRASRGLNAIDGVAPLLSALRPDGLPLRLGAWALASGLAMLGRRRLASVGLAAWVGCGSPRLSAVGVFLSILGLALFREAVLARAKPALALRLALPIGGAALIARWFAPGLSGMS